MNKNDYFDLATRILSERYSSDDKELHGFLLMDEKYSTFFKWYKSKWQEEKVLDDLNFDYSRGLELLRKKIAVNEKQSRKSSTKVFPLAKRALQIAASVLIILGLGYFSNSLIQHNTDHARNNTIIKKTTKTGERVQISLPDGSTVHLNSESEISFVENFEKNKRIIHLTGEAFFEVVRDENRPFIVRSGELTTTVLGTRFNVSNRQEIVYVTLQSGKVKVTGEHIDGEIYLIPGEQFGIDYSTGRAKKIKVNPDLFTDWHRGTLQFDEVKFADALLQLESWYDVKIECNADELLARNIRGKYTNEDLTTILEDLKFMFDFEFEFVTDSTIIIKSN
jgi:transmembrane sensor